MDPILVAAMRKRGGAFASALSNLTQTLTINGVTKTPSLYLLGQDATATTWNSRGGGANLAIGGTGTLPTTGQDVPTIASADEGVLFAAGQKAYFAAATSVCEIGTGDAVFEAVHRSDDTAASKNLLHTRVGTGYTFRHSAGEYQLYITGADGSVVVASVGGEAITGVWTHLMVFVDYSGKASMYINGAHEGTMATDISSAGAIANGTAMACCNSFVGNVAQIGVWQGANWLDTSVQPALAAARFRALCGTKVDSTRDSVAYLHKPVSGAQKYFLVGKNWSRLSQDLTGKPYYQAEDEATNLIEEASHDLGSWPANGGVTTALEAGVLSPQATMISEDDSDGGHILRTNPLAALVNGKTYTFWAILEAESRHRGFLQIENDGDHMRVTYDLTAKTAVAEVVDDFGSESASIDEIEPGIFLVSVTATVTGGTAVYAAELWMADGTGDLTYEGNESEALKVHHIQLEEAAAATSPIDNLTTTPETRAADIVSMSALENLSQSLTIAGVTKTPTFIYEGKNATTTAWVATVGEDLVIGSTGTDPTVGQDTPLLDGADKSVLGGEKHYLSSGNGPYPLTTDDFVIGMLFYHAGTATKVPAAQFPVSGLNTGWELLTVITTKMSIYLSDGVGTFQPQTDADLVPDSWNWAEIYVDTSGTARWFVNGLASGTPLDVSTMGSIPSAVKFTLMNRADGIFDYDGGLAYISLHQGAAWMDTSDQSALALARFKALSGVSTYDTRDSLAYTHKVVDGAKKYFLVGKNWQRLARGLEDRPHYLDEAAATNLQHRGDAIADWSVTDASVATTSIETPFGTRTDVVVHEDDSIDSATHRVFREHGTRTAAAPYVTSFYSKAINRSWAYFDIKDAPSDHSAYINLSTGAVGTLENLSAGDVTSEDVGDGWYRWEFSWTPSDTSGNVLIYVAEGDGDRTFTGLDQDSFAISKVMLEAGSKASSPISTPTTAAVTRLADA